MSVKELIEAEISAMDEKQLNELYPIVKQFAEAKKQAPQSFMSKIRSIPKIDAPEDFATNLDLYMSGEKRVP
ncbi:MAG TPA: hypothetical protein VF627_13585 [Abditibacterium sp.]|jgi:hypothetical protein